MLGVGIFYLYLILFVLCWLILPQTVKHVSFGESFGLALSVLTGSDPNSFTELQDAKSIAGLSLALTEACTSVLVWAAHILSWLLIPAIVAKIVVERALQIKSERKKDLDRSIDAYVSRIGNVVGDMTAEETRDFAALIHERIERERRSRQR